MRAALIKLGNKISSFLNRYSLKRKFFSLYVVCVILPVIVTDGILLDSVYEREVRAVETDMEYITGIYKDNLENKVALNQTMANAVNINTRINEFVTKDYASPYEYYVSYYDIIQGSLLQTISGVSKDTIVIYADNENILEGESFKKISSIETEDWYQDFKANGSNDKVYAFYSSAHGEIGNQRRKFYYVKNLTYNRKEKERIVVVKNNYDSFARGLKQLGKKYPMYISCGDYILFTNMDDSALYVEDLDVKDYKPYTTDITLQGADMKIVLFREKRSLLTIIADNAPILIVVILATLLLPIFLLTLIQKSIVSRIHKLELAFGKNTGETFYRIEGVDGTDEIAGLMNSYNDMVDITNNLIETVYKDKLREHENDLARKNAELLALQSQINPHFLFNALESIRMHSLLKGENETSDMVGRLAKMQRQNVEWSRDFVSIKQEMDSIETYLTLQSYRFGDRLSFRIEIDEDCEDIMVPKLTFVTFVENACVHGIESKPTPGWIFVRAFRKDGNLIIEVEDTGGGMSDEAVTQMLEDINNVSIDVIREKKHVGVLNACLRLKTVTNGRVRFEIDSEEGIGMCFVITIPLEELEV
mgnify:CR=1 FL=1